MELLVLLSPFATAFIGFLLIFKFYFMKAARCKSTVCLDGKTVIITGASTGIGKETAFELAKRGARIIMACKDLKRAKEAACYIEDHVPGSDLVIKHLDLASLKSIREFAEDICTNEKSVDILINSAAVGFIPYTKTEDGFEATLGINHLGHFLLTNLLLTKLISSAPSRIINVAAHAHIFYNIDFQDLMLERSYGSVKAYCRSKLANVLFTRELAQRLRGTGVTTYALHPGLVHTELSRHLYIMKIPVLSSFLNLFSKLLLKSPKEGCQTVVYCAVAEELAGENGLYYSNCALSMLAMTALHKGHAKLMWQISSELVGLPNEQVEGQNEDEDSSVAAEDSIEEDLTDTEFEEEDMFDQSYSENGEI